MQLTLISDSKDITAGCNNHGWNRSRCIQSCCVLYSLLPLRSVGRSNFDKGSQILITLNDKKRHKIIIEMKLLHDKMESTVGSYEKETLYIFA